MSARRTAVALATAAALAMSASPTAAAPTAAAPTSAVPTTSVAPTAAAPTVAPSTTKPTLSPSVVPTTKPSTVPTVKPTTAPAPTTKPREVKHPNITFTPVAGQCGVFDVYVYIGTAEVASAEVLYSGGTKKSISVGPSRIVPDTGLPAGPTTVTVAAFDAQGTSVGTSSTTYDCQAPTDTPTTMDGVFVYQNGQACSLPGETAPNMLEIVNNNAFPVTAAVKALNASGAVIVDTTISVAGDTYGQQEVPIALGETFTWSVALTDPSGKVTTTRTVTGTMTAEPCQSLVFPRLTSQLTYKKGAPTGTVSWTITNPDDRLDKPETYDVVVTNKMGGRWVRTVVVGDGQSVTSSIPGVPVGDYTIVVTARSTGESETHYITYTGGYKPNPGKPAAKPGQEQAKPGLASTGEA